MRRVANLYPIIAKQLVDRLQAASIPASATQNLDMSGYPMFPLTGLWTVWIPDDAEVHEAQRITKAFIKALPPPSEDVCRKCGNELPGHCDKGRCPECGESFRRPAAEVECPQCGELVPGTFGSCWNCGAEMDEG